MPRRGRVTAPPRAAACLQLVATLLLAGLAHARWLHGEPPGQQDNRTFRDECEVVCGAACSGSGRGRGEAPPLDHQHLGSPQRPIYSSYVCHGPHRFFAPDCQSCRFHDVCYDAVRDAFVYYRDPGMRHVPLLFSSSGEPLYAFPPRWAVSGMKRTPEHQLSFQPEVVHERIPATAKLRPGLALLAGYNTRVFDGYSIGWNLGHHMWEHIMPLFTLNQTVNFGLPVTVLYHDRMAQPCADAGAGGANAGVGTRAHCGDSWLGSLFGGAHESLAGLRANASAAQPLVCFQALAVGDVCLNRMFDHTRSAIPDAAGFREAVHRALRPPGGPALRRAGASRPRVAIVVKEGSRRPVNYGEVRDVLAERFPGARVRLWERSSDLPMERQIEYVAATSVLITPQGGMSTLCVYLPPGGTCIVLGGWNTKTNRTFEYDHLQYARFSHFKLVIFTPQASDYERLPTIGACRGKGLDHSHLRLGGDLVYCDYWLNATRLSLMVAEELQLMCLQAQCHSSYGPCPVPPLEPTDPMLSAASRLSVGAMPRPTPASWFTDLGHRAMRGEPITWLVLLACYALLVLAAYRVFSRYQEGQPPNMLLSKQRAKPL